VAEENVGRYAAGLGLAAPKAAQLLEQAAVDAFPRLGGDARLGSRLLRTAPRRLQQPHRALLAHHLPGSIVQLQHWILITVLPQHFLADKLENPVADFALRVFAE